MSVWRENRFGIVMVAGVGLLNLGVLGVVGAHVTPSYENYAPGAIATERPAEQTHESPPPAHPESQTVGTPAPAASSDPMTGLPSPSSTPPASPSPQDQPAADTAPATTDTPPSGDPASSPLPGETPPASGDSQSDAASPPKQDEAPVVIPIPAQGPSPKDSPEGQAPSAPASPATPSSPASPATPASPSTPSTTP